MSDKASPSFGWRLRFAAEVLAAAAVVAAVAAGLIFWTGVYDVSARKDHPTVIAWLLHQTMLNSVAHNAAPRTPPDLDDPLLILRGATHFATGCAPCHGAPGELASPIARMITPVPPGLYSVDREFTPSQVFWIVQNGVKMTAMPAWPAPHRDDEIWAMVAFLEHLPRLNTEAYGNLSGLSENGSMLLSGTTPTPAVADRSAFDAADCARCHGPAGGGRDHAFPQIAGLGAAYIEQSLLNFRDGSRPSGFMQPVAAALSDSQIKQAATYYAALPRQQGTAGMADAAALSIGAKLASGHPEMGGAPGCLSCHFDGKGTADVPDLAGQPVDYLATQLRLFRSGQRRGTPAAMKMVAIAQALTDQQIAAVSGYLATLPVCAAAASGATACPSSPRP